jgi:hypothetical protein
MYWAYGRQLMYWVGYFQLVTDSSEGISQVSSSQVAVDVLGLRKAVVVGLVIFS